MRVGYARVSTTEQPIEGQLARLTDCARVFSEKWSGAKQDRKALEECLAFVREGDTLVVTRLDRLARSVSHLCLISETLRTKGVDLVVLDQDIRTDTPMGRLVFHVLAAIAEFELGLRKEQQRAGIAHARAIGKHMGQPPRLSGPDRAQAVADIARGATYPTVARRYRISESTIRRYVRSAGTTDTT